jgi:ribonuclease-3
MHPADALIERLGLPIRDRDLLAQALVHSSWLHEHPDAARGHNERLEFLGDAVVSLAVSEALYRRHPNDDEGVLSARRAAIVSTPGLARLAARLDLGSFLFLGEGEAQRGGRVRPSLLASAFEALVGAIYLDLGWDAAREWIVGWAAHEIAADSALTTLKSPKSRLQEHTQRTTGDRPLYRLLEAVGPDHEKQFRIEVIVDGRVLGVGEGLSRRIAETSAAAEALEVLRTERQAARTARAAAAAEVREADEAIGLLDAAEPAIEAAATDAGDTVVEPDDDVDLDGVEREDLPAAGRVAPDPAAIPGPDTDPDPAESSAAS